RTSRVNGLFLLASTVVLEQRKSCYCLYFTAVTPTLALLVGTHIDPGESKSA
ncbi:unnamed protein product, partial [Amoebophrya sp. A120]